MLRQFDREAVSRFELQAGLEAGAIAARAFDPLLLLPAIAGAVSDEAWRESVIASLSDTIAPDRARQVVAEWSASPGRIDVDVRRLLYAVRATAPVVILTNATSRLRSDLDALGVTDEFDGIVSSAETGVPKPEAGAFRAAQAVVSDVIGWSVAPANLLFVDDDRRNVDAAADLGWNAVHFTDPVSLARSFAVNGLLTQA